MSPKDRLETIFRLTPLQKAGLKKLRLTTAEDLLYYFPSRYEKTSESSTISTLIRGTKTAIFGKIRNLETLKAFRKKIPMAKAIVEDQTGQVECVWFNQPYIAKMIRENSLVRIEGIPSERKSANKETPGKLYFSNPAIEMIETIPMAIGNSLFGQEDLHILRSIYPETKGLTSLWFFHAIQKLIKNGIHENIPDPVPENVIDNLHLPKLSSSLVWIHAPKKDNQSEVARKRFAFEEIFFLQLKNLKDKKELGKMYAPIISPTKESLKGFSSRFPFKYTSAQEKSINTILDDFKKGSPMSRLLNGDVGSGKTAVAATTTYAAANEKSMKDFGHSQVAYMAPTEILATQHFESFIEYFKGLNLPIGLLTGAQCRKFPSKINPNGSTQIAKAQLLKWVANGEIPILIGTHALIQGKVKFKNLVYVIIDEQHRFGTNQRKKLARKDDSIPHLLTMTATPIPRTLALTIYGNLDLSLLDEMPQGRKPIITEIVLPSDRKKTYEFIRSELERGRQVYVICPRINEPDPDLETALLAKSVKEESKRLKRDVFPEYEIGILHSKMTPIEKEKQMLAFKAKKIDILVATSVVEVGVNVENATLIVIEGAERFGLSQLHQLRGRVIRGNHQAYCFVFAETKSQKTIDRLKAFKLAKNGFELSELDLKLRGSGGLYGDKQWGISDIGMEAIRNLKLVEAARAEAKRIITDDLLDSYPELEKKLSEKSDVHLE